MIPIKRTPFNHFREPPRGASSVGVAACLSNVLSKEQDAKSISTLIVNLNNQDTFRSPYNGLSQKIDIDITRCGVMADSFLNCIYFSSEDELHGNMAVHHFDIDFLQKVMKKKSLVCKVVWAVWQRDLFELNEASGEFLMPAYEHTFLIDLVTAKNSSEGANHYAYIIQSAFQTYYSSAKPVTSEFLWSHLNFLNKFDRRTLLDWKSLSDWIEKGLFLNQIAQDESLKSLEGKDYVGQLTSFTGYSYNPEAALSRLSKIRLT